VLPGTAVYSLFNANAVLRTVNTYGGAWQNVTTVLGSRVVEFGAQVHF
jgi:hypothetical protein